MYDFGPVVEAKEAVVEKSNKQEYEAMIAFINEEFLLYDFKANKWHLGDFNDATITVPENATLVKLDAL